MEQIVTKIEELSGRRRLVYINGEQAFALYSTEVRRYGIAEGKALAQEDLEQLRDFVASLKTVKRFEVLPYHTLGVFKWEELGIPYTLSDVMPPDKEQIARANDILRTAEYTGYLEK